MIVISNPRDPKASERVIVDLIEKAGGCNQRLARLRPWF